MKDVLIIGKPNSGKSLLFNRLTGLQQKVANFPGVTVDIKTGSSGDFNFTDFPGVYSFQPLTKDEEIAVSEFQTALANEKIKAVICVLDATRLERSLALGLQARNHAIKTKKPILFALNMMDELEKNKIQIDVLGLEKELESKVVSISAKTKMGLEELKSRLNEMIESQESSYASNDLLLEQAEVLSLSKKINKKYGPKADYILKKQNKLDQFFLSSLFGGLTFVGIMLLLFQSIFTWAAPLMDFIEEIIAKLGEASSALLPPGVAQDFINEAIFGGFGSFLVFVPQIFLLTFIIGLLQDSGYLARASIICHKPLSLFGLSGKSFVPLLTGHACAIPAIMAARTIESPKRRLITMISLPLIACSARLPVYALLVAVLIPPVTFAGGLIGLQGFSFFALYFFGILMAILVSSFLSKSVYKSECDSPFIIELPPYRLPHWKPLIQNSAQSSWAFIRNAGGIIFTVTVVVWILGYFPNGTGELSTSWLSYIGKAFEPIFAPLGIDWKFAVAILASFLAREVFVGTLGTLYGIEGADENIASLADNITAQGMSFATGMSLLVFYAIAMQCVSTLAVLKKETGSYKIPVLVFLVYSLLAYSLAFISYQILS